MADLLTRLKQSFPAARLHEPLGPHSTFGVGGRALGWLGARGADELVRTVNLARQNKIPFALVAGGSNVVFSDREYRGLVISFFNPKPKFSYQVAARELTAEAGAPLALLIKQALKRGWAGLESLSGIPGSIGGAVVGNAGAYGHSISECVQAVQVLDLGVAPQPFSRIFGNNPQITRKGSGSFTKWLTRAECQFAYRDSIFKHQNLIVLRVKFRFQSGDSKELTKRSREIIKIRTKKYRPGLACPGSFFKNILASQTAKKVLAKIDQTKIIEGKIPAGYLLEQVGAKGLKTKHLEIADFHGNLIINRGGATSQEVKKLAARLRRRVKTKFGLTLEEEVRYML